MVLQDLISLYDRLAVTGQVPTLFHSALSIGVDVIIDDKGRILSAMPTVKTDDKTPHYPKDLACQVSPKSADRRNDWYNHPHGVVEQLEFVVQCASNNEDFRQAHRSYLQQLKRLAVKSNSADVKALLKALRLLDSKDAQDKLKNAAAKSVKVDKDAYAKSWADLTEQDSKGKLTDKARKLYVRWRLVSNPTCINQLPEVQTAWIQMQYLKAVKNARREFRTLKRASTLTGEIVLPASTIDHLTIPGKGKLVSFNENSLYNTYSSASFSDHELYVSGAKEVQKYGQAMRWLVSECPVYVGDVLYIIWRDDADNKPWSLFKEQLGEDKPIYDNGYGDEVTTANECRSLIRAKLGMKANLKDSHDVHLIGIRLAKGRLSLVAFHRITLEDFADANAAFLSDTAMGIAFRGKKAKSSVIVNRSPTIHAIIKAANPKSGPDKKNKIPVWWDAMPRATLFKNQLPLSLIDVLLRKALTNQDDETVWLAAAAYRNYRLRTRKEDSKMSLDVICVDRSYRAGRLLAVHYWIQTDRGKGNPNNKASALMQSLISRPQLIGRIEHASMPYLKRMPAGLKRYFENILGEIYDPFTSEGLGTAALDSGRVIVGYHHQLTALKTGGSHSNEGTPNQSSQPDETTVHSSKVPE